MWFSSRICETYRATALTEAIVRRNFCMIPSARLQQHEYAAHGVCAWDSPDAYFDRSRKLWDGLTKPVLTGTITAGNPTELRTATSTH